MSAFDLRLSESVPGGLESLIESVPFGSAGLRYRRLNTGDQIDRFHAPLFITAHRDQRLIGAYVIDRRTLMNNDQLVTGFYRGLLAVQADFQRQGVGRQLTLAGFEWIQTQAASSSEAVLTYGCIDASNDRSLALLRQQGAVQLGSLSRFMVYSQWPRDGKAGSHLQPVEERLARVLLGETIVDCRLRDVTASKSEFQGMFIGGQLIACARVSRSLWRIEDMGRILGLTDRCLIRPFPMARRRFNSECFECLQLSDVGLRAGSEQHWSGFVSALLARHEMHFAMLLIDPGSALHRRLRRIGWLGPLVHGTKPDIHVMGRWLGKDVNGIFDVPGETAPLALAPVDL